MITEDAEAIRVAVELLSVEDERDLRDGARLMERYQWRAMLHAALYRALARQ